MARPIKPEIGPGPSSKYARLDEQIVEFQFPGGGEGKISLSIRGGRKVVELFDLDADIQVILPANNILSEGGA